MSNFLVQSGSIRLEVEAGDCHKAALWAVHQSLESGLPREAASGTSGASGSDSKEGEAVSVGRLGRYIRVMRTDGTAAECFDTYAVLLEWSQLLAALDRVESAMHAESLPPQADLEPALIGAS